MSQFENCRSIIHADMDAFFASVEQLDAPQLRGLPVIVGGAAESRGVVSAASYEARKFGVHSAMPCFQAVKLCPIGIFVRPRMERYAELSHQIHEIFSRYTDLIEALSLDEAFLDVSGSRKLFGPAEEIGRKLKTDIKAELSLIVSVGIAPNKFLAKLASDHDKPDGFCVISPDKITEFLSPLPIERIWDVGKETAKCLHARGIKQVAQLLRFTRDELTNSFGLFGERLYELCRGIDDREVIPSEEIKSVSHETTFSRDISDRETIRQTLFSLAEKTARRLRRKNIKGKTIVLKVKLPTFKLATRQLPLVDSTDDEAEIYHTACRLWDESGWDGEPVRLVGVGGAGLILEEEDHQESLFSDLNKSRKNITSSVDTIKNRFGDSAVTRGRKLKKQK